MYPLADLDFVAHIVFAAPVAITHCVSLSFCLEFRHPKLFWACESAFLIAAILLSQHLPLPLWLLTVIVASVALPVSLSVGNLSRRLFYALILQTMLFASRSISIAIICVLSLLFGNLPPLLGATSQLELTLALPLDAPVFFLLVLPLIHQTGHPSNVNRLGPGMTHFMIPALSQTLLLVLMLLFGNSLGFPPDIAIGTAAVAALCLLCDRYLFRAISQLNHIRAKELFALQIQEYVDLQDKDFDEGLSRVERVSRLRHDLRGQLQTVEMLSTRRDTQSARRHVEQMIECLAESEV